MPSRSTAAFGRSKFRFLALAPCVGTIIFLLGSIVGQSALGQQNPNQSISSSEILAKVQASYQTLQSYRLTAVRGFEENAEAPEISISDSRRFSTITIDLSAAGPSAGSIFLKYGKREIQSFSDGRTVWTYQPEKKSYSVTPLASADPTARAKTEKAAQENANLLKTFERVLVDRYRNITQLSSKFVQQKDRTLEQDGAKVECYVLKIVLPNEWHEIWVDKVRFIVRRSVDYTEELITPNDKKKITLTLTLKSLDADAKFDESAFGFTPPAGTKQVRSVETQWAGTFDGFEGPPVR